MRVVISCLTGQTAFGLRSFAAYNRSYQSSGMVTSQPIYLSGTAATFFTEQVTTSPCTSITHQISTDGVNFVSITPGVVPVSQPFWYRAILNRSDSAFNQQSSPLLPLPSSAAANTPYTINSQTTTTLDNRMVEQTIVLSNVSGPVVFQDAPLTGSLSSQVGSAVLEVSLGLHADWHHLDLCGYSSTGDDFMQDVNSGICPSPSLQNYYSPLLYEARFQAV